MADRTAVPRVNAVDGRRGVGDVAGAGATRTGHSWSEIEVAIQALLADGKARTYESEGRRRVRTVGGRVKQVVADGRPVGHENSDLGRGCLAREAFRPPAPGISEVLEGRRSLRGSILPLDLVHQSDGCFAEVVGDVETILKLGRVASPTGLTALMIARVEDAPGLVVEEGASQRLEVSGRDPGSGPERVVHDPVPVDGGALTEMETLRRSSRRQARGRRFSRCGQRWSRRVGRPRPGGGVGGRARTCRQDCHGTDHYPQPTDGPGQRSEPPVAVRILKAGQGQVHRLIGRRGL